MTNLDELERLAKAATPGPWDLEHDDTFVAGPTINGEWSWIVGDISSEHEDEIDYRGENLKNNCRLISAANPETILKLIKVARSAHAVTQGHEQDDCEYFSVPSGDVRTLRKALAALEGCVDEQD